MRVASEKLPAIPECTAKYSSKISNSSGYSDCSRMEFACYAMIQTVVKRPKPSFVRRRLAKKILSKTIPPVQRFIFGFGAQCLQRHAKTGIREEVPFRAMFGQSGAWQILGYPRSCLTRDAKRNAPLVPGTVPGTIARPTISSGLISAGLNHSGMVATSVAVIQIHMPA